MLSDDRRRWEYDRFEYPIVTGEVPEGYEYMMSPGGHSFVWESTADSARRAQQGRTGMDGFPRSAFDPFELFNSMFARDFHEMEVEGYAHSDMPPGFRRPTSFGAPPPSMLHDPFGGLGGFGTSPFNMMAGFPPAHASMPGGQMYTTSTSFSLGGQNTGGTSETRRTTVVNGRRETIITKRDPQGNETVRRITPEGETVHVNGQLQSALEGGSAAAPPAVEAAPAAEEPEPVSPPPRRRKWKFF